EEAGHALAQGAAQVAAQLRTEGAGHAGAHHAHAPEQQGDAGGQIQQKESRALLLHHAITRGSARRKGAPAASGTGRTFPDMSERTLRKVILQIHYTRMTESPSLCSG